MRGGVDTTPPQAQSKYFCTTYCVDTIFISYLERLLPRRTFHSVFFFVFFFFSFFYTASIFLPIFTFKRQRRRSQSHSPTATSGSLPHCRRPLVPPAGPTGREGGREGGRELRASVLLPFYLFHLLLLVSFCELGATCCCGCVSRLTARFAKEKKKKNNTSMNPTICSPHRLRRFKQVETQGGAVSHCVHFVALFHIYLLKYLWISPTFSLEENENCQKKLHQFFFPVLVLRNIENNQINSPFIPPHLQWLLDRVAPQSHICFNSRVQPSATSTWYQMDAVPPPATTSLGAVLALATILSAVLPLTTGQDAVLLPLGRVQYCCHLSGCSTATHQMGVQLVLETFSFSDCTLQDFVIFFNF